MQRWFEELQLTHYFKSCSNLSVCRSLMAVTTIGNQVQVCRPHNWPSVPCLHPAQANCYQPISTYLGTHTHKPDVHSLKTGDTGIAESKGEAQSWHQGIRWKPDCWLIQISILLSPYLVPRTAFKHIFCEEGN